MSLKDELEKIIDAESRDLKHQDRPTATLNRLQKDRFDEVRPLFTEFAEAVDDAFVKVRLTDARVVIDVGDQPSDEDLFEIDGRWELEPSPAPRFLAEPGHRALRRRSGFVLWKTMYLRPLMEPDNLTWDRLDFDSGEEAFDYVMRDVAKQVARCRKKGR